MAGKTVRPPYNLQVPLQDEVADVPTDIEDLANTVADALDKKVTSPVNTNISAYQPKIAVYVGTSTSVLPATAVEGTVVFLVAP